MTEAQLRLLVVRWQKRLAALGVAHWRVESVEVVGVLGEDGEDHASVTWSERYDKCRFKFLESWLDEATFSEVERTVIHEWLHVAFRDYDVAVRSIDGRLAPDVRVEWDERVTHEEEGVVDRLAYWIWENS